MAKKKNVARMAEPPAKQAPWLASQRLLWPGFALALLIFYWTLFDDQATIQWDTVDVHYSAQKYFEQSLAHHWTPALDALRVFGDALPGRSSNRGIHCTGRFS